jgi:hypothetical protein
MQETLTNKFKFFDSYLEFSTLKEEVLEETNVKPDLTSLSKVEEKASNINKFYSSIEDSNNYLENFYSGKDIILNESWLNTESIKGKIVHFNEQKIFVDCLIDYENQLFQHREFPILLFKNISNISNNMPVIIKTSSKPGAIRIDVYPGAGIVDLELFEINDIWDDLENSGLDHNLSEW